MALQWPFLSERISKLGDLFSLKDVKDFTGKFKAEVNLAKGEDSLSSKFLVNGEVRTGEFFGIDKIYQLITLAKEKSNTIAGIRVYYGLAHESFDNKSGESAISTSAIDGADDSSLRPRLFLVAVDETGADIEINLSSLKDVPDGNGLGNGSPQPPFGNG
ncbi:hypothetical protein [Emticicia agri]|uniref:Uncharacterized protein n=1 Tax=Emticicia agri TaxID=2492393 RepID=A0A4Q5M4L3_9BACT|nr:hypothetical protein [Emticicia agri]RYU96807.1 hypothetical protein EWM59_04580 [Emticicia agri]